VSGLASCLRAVGNVSVYRQVEQAQSDGNGRSTNASVLWEEFDNEFAAALSNRTEEDGSLQGVPGLIDVFSCTVTPLRNATTPVPEGSGRINGTNYTASDDPQPDNSQQDRSATTPSSGISAYAGVGIAIAVMVVLLLAVLLLVRHRRLRHQQRPFAAVKDGGDSSSTGYDSTDDYGSVPAMAGGLKILGPARDDRKEEEAVSPDPPSSEDGEDGDEEITSGKDAADVESDHEPPTVERRLIDHEDNHDEEGPSDDDTRDVEIIPVFRLLTALEINPTEDDQSLMSIVREKRNYE
jgi:hypothetical protein